MKKESYLFFSIKFRTDRQNFYRNNVKNLALIQKSFLGSKKMLLLFLKKRDFI
jgi:hypothetical protein